MSSPTNPGSPRPWVVAWTLQGVLVVGLELSGLAPGPWRFAFLGPLAALPLLGLYLWLRPAPSPSGGGGEQG